MSEVVTAEGRVLIPKGRPMTDSERLRVVQAFCEDWTLSRDADLRSNLCRMMGWKMPQGAR